MENVGSKKFAFSQGFKIVVASVLIIGAASLFFIKLGFNTNDNLYKSNNTKITQKKVEPKTIVDPQKNTESTSTNIK